MEHLLRGAERKADSLRARAEANRPGLPANASPIEIARILGHQVKYSARLRGQDGTWSRPTERRPYSVIYLALRGSPTRHAFTAGHELMEANLPHDQQGRCMIPDEAKEEWCDRGAAALLMPADAFMESGRLCGWDLEQLREWWPHSSWNALVRRIADLVPGTAAGAWKAQQRRFRATHPEIELPEHADALEEFVACEALHAPSGASELELGGIHVRAWRSGPGRVVSVLRRAA